MINSDTKSLIKAYRKLCVNQDPTRIRGILTNQESKRILSDIKIRNSSAKIIIVDELVSWPKQTLRSGSALIQILEKAQNQIDKEKTLASILSNEY